MVVGTELGIHNILVEIIIMQIHVQTSDLDQDVTGSTNGRQEAYNGQVSLIGAIEASRAPVGRAS